MNKNVTKIYGLVLTGGKSTRMKKDKALLNFHGKTQYEFCYELLSEFCNQVFISSRNDQSKNTGPKGYAEIHDLKEYEEIGPLAGILSAMQQFPDVSWLVLACDLPFVTKSTIAHLIEKRNSKKIATVYQSVHDQLPEPLCAIYEPKALEQLKKNFQQGTYCPRKILINSNIELIKPIDKKSLNNINTPDQYNEVLQTLKGEKENIG